MTANIETSFASVTRNYCIYRVIVHIVFDILQIQSILCIKHSY